MKYSIYADNAATTKLSPAAFEAMVPWLLDEYGNASQPYSFSRKPKKALADARTIIAECIGADTDEIYFTSGGTESDNWAIKGTALAGSVNDGALLTSAFEHHAVLRAAESIEALLYPVAYMWPSNDGFITPEILSKYISNETRMVSVMMANNELGTIQPIKELCDIAHKHGAIFHTDAVQAVGHIPINVHELGVDLLSASAHKFNGPKGIGFLYIRKGTKIHPYSDGGAQEYKMRAGTENIASIVGMATALQENCSALAENICHINAIEEQLIEGLNSQNISYVRNGKAPYIPGLLSLSFDGHEGESILHRMDLLGISISTGSACDSVNTQISHVLKAMNMDEKQAKGTIRISLGKYNSLDEANTIIKALQTITRT